MVRRSWRIRQGPQVVIEGMIFLHHHDDVIDALQSHRTRGWWRRSRATSSATATAGEQKEAQQKNARRTLRGPVTGEEVGKIHNDRDMQAKDVP